jgi:hypothetical protein
MVTFVSELRFNPLQTKRRSSPYRAVNTFHLGYKKQLIYVSVAQVAVCSQRNTKHINTVLAERKIVECKTCWCIT